MAAGRLADYANQVPKLWASDLYSQAENMTFWSRFEGTEGSSMPIVRKDDLTKTPGDTIKYDIVLSLAGTGSVGDTALTDGAEEKVIFRQTSLPLNSLKHAVRWSWLTEVEITHDMRRSGLNQLKKWLAGKLDDAIFGEFTGRTTVTGITPNLTEANLPTASRFFAGTATTIATVADSDAVGRLKLNDISDVKAYAQTQNKIEPLRTEDGLEYFGLVIHPYAALALKKDSQWQQAQREAQNAGAGNPLFTGAVGMWDGVILYVSPRVPTANDGAASITVARNIFFGSQALCRGYALYPTWAEQEFSYGEEIGIATRSVFGNKLNVFDLNSSETGGSSLDDTAIGSMVLATAAVAPVA